MIPLYNSLYMRIYFKVPKSKICTYMSHICRQAYKSNCPICYSNKHLCAIFFVRRLDDKNNQLSCLDLFHSKHVNDIYMLRMSLWWLYHHHLSFGFLPYLCFFLFVSPLFFVLSLISFFLLASTAYLWYFLRFCIACILNKVFCWENQLQLIVFNIDLDLFVE